jgi:hypothetical protein
MPDPVDDLDQKIADAMKSVCKTAFTEGHKRGKAKGTTDATARVLEALEKSAKGIDYDALEKEVEGEDGDG